MARAISLQAPNVVRFYRCAGKGLLSLSTTSDEIDEERAANVFPPLGS